MSVLQSYLSPKFNFLHLPSGSDADHEDYGIGDTLCDVQFQLCDSKGWNKTIRAHKLILAWASCVFKSQFFGELKSEGPASEGTFISYCSLCCNYPRKQKNTT